MLRGIGAFVRRGCVADRFRSVLVSAREMKPHTTRTMSEPRMASRSELIENSVTPVPKMALPIQPPTRAPITPQMSAPIQPPPWRPGRIAFAIAPAMRPRMRNAMMPMYVSFPLTVSARCAHGTAPLILRLWPPGAA